MLTLSIAKIHPEKFKQMSPKLLWGLAMIEFNDGLLVIVRRRFDFTRAKVPNAITLGEGTRGWAHFIWDQRPWELVLESRDGVWLTRKRVPVLH